MWIAGSVDAVTSDMDRCLWQGRVSVVEAQEQIAGLWEIGGGGQRQGEGGELVEGVRFALFGGEVVAIAIVRQAILGCRGETALLKVR